MKKTQEKLTRFLNTLADISGHPWMFLGALSLVLTWFVVGIFMDYDSTWFDIMDIFIFLSTYFLVFIVQASQNADTKAIQDKLDELVNATDSASNKVKGEEKLIKAGKKKAH